MPNFGLLATETDLLLLLDQLFEESPCVVYESYPPRGQPVRQFRSAEAIAAALGTGGVGGGDGEERGDFHLRIWSPAMRAAPTITRHAQTDRLRQPTFRELCTGWGLLVLIGEGYSANLAWNGESRARSRADADEYARWDWAGVESTAALVRRIARGLAADRARSMPVLPNAAELLGRQRVPAAG